MTVCEVNTFSGSLTVKLVDRLTNVGDLNTSNVLFWVVDGSCCTQKALFELLQVSPLLLLRGGGGVGGW